MPMICYTIFDNFENLHLYYDCVDEMIKSIRDAVQVDFPSMISKLEKDENTEKLIERKIKSIEKIFYDNSSIKNFALKSDRKSVV